MTSTARVSLLRKIGFMTAVLVALAPGAAQADLVRLTVSGYNETSGEVWGDPALGAVSLPVLPGFGGGTIRQSGTRFTITDLSFTCSNNSNRDCSWTLLFWAGGYIGQPMDIPSDGASLQMDGRASAAIPNVTDATLIMQGLTYGGQNAYQLAAIGHNLPNGEFTADLWQNRSDPEPQSCTLLPPAPSMA